MVVFIDVVKSDNNKYHKSDNKSVYGRLSLKEKITNQNTEKNASPTGVIFNCTLFIKYLIL